MSCSIQVDPKHTVNKICQMISIQLPNSGAGTRTRTADLLITNQLLYQLSYASSGAGKENRTPILSLEGCDNTIILYPLTILRNIRQCIRIFIHICFCFNFIIYFVIYILYLNRNIFNIIFIKHIHLFIIKTCFTILC